MGFSICCFPVFLFLFFLIVLRIKSKFFRGFSFDGRFLVEWIGSRTSNYGLDFQFEDPFFSKLSLGISTIYSIQNRHAQIWSLRGLVVPLFKVLPVKIWPWNLAHRFRRSNAALGIFFWVRIFSGGFSMGLQRNLVVPGFWATGKRWEAEILQVASLIQFRTSKFYPAQ
jgi:hypothetical protein